MIVMYGKGKVGESVVALCTYMGLPVILMDDADKNEDILIKAQYIVVTPGIKQSHPIYRQFSEKVLSELDFLTVHKDRFSFWDNAIYIGITGTNGKSTTSYVLDCILSRHFSTRPDFKCWLGGNFSAPLSSLFLKILQDKLEEKRHIFVIESSSFMLAHTHIFRYAYWVFLNIAVDHLDWHMTMENYTLAKENILRLSTQSFISDSVVPLLSQRYQNLYVFDAYPTLENTHFLGKHNQQNLWAAYAVYSALCKDLHLPEQDFIVLLQDIYPLAHRLSPIKTIGDVTIIDDGICTSAAACMAALEAMNKKCVLIAWWYDKGDDYTILQHIFSEKVSHIILLGQVAQRIAKVADDAEVPYTHVSQLSEAVQLAVHIAQNNWSHYVLFSPGAASFDMFTNVYDRIDQFVAIVEAL